MPEDGGLDELAEAALARLAPRWRLPRSRPHGSLWKGEAHAGRELLSAGCVCSPLARVVPAWVTGRSQLALIPCVCV